MKDLNALMEFWLEWNHIVDYFVWLDKNKSVSFNMLLLLIINICITHNELSNQLTCVNLLAIEWSAIVYEFIIFPHWSFSVVCVIYDCFQHEFLLQQLIIYYQLVWLHRPVAVV